jgi:hypothetical protein
VPDFPLNLNHVEPSAIAAAMDAGFVIAQTVNGVWSLRDVDASRVPEARAFIRAYDPMALERGFARARVKAEADRRIAGLVSLVDQVLLISSSVDLIDKRISGLPWTTEEETTAATARAMWRKARVIRRAQVRIVQQEVMPLDNTNALQAFDPVKSHRWPTAEEIDAPDPIVGEAHCMTAPVSAVSS